MTKPLEEQIKQVNEFLVSINKQIKELYDKHHFSCITHRLLGDTTSMIQDNCREAMNMIHHMTLALKTNQEKMSQPVKEQLKGLLYSINKKANTLYNGAPADFSEYLNEPTQAIQDKCRDALNLVNSLSIQERQEPQETIEIPGKEIIERLDSHQKRIDDFWGWGIELEGYVRNKQAPNIQTLFKRVNELDTIIHRMQDKLDRR